MERLFNLDPQLLHDSALLAINVFVLFALLSFILFEPVRQVIKKRKEQIEADNKEAENNRLEASKLKDEYESKLQNADKEADELLSEARKKATQTSNNIINEAKTEATRITDHAHNEAELEKKRVADDVKKEIVSVASMMAKKVVSENISEEDKEKVLDQTLEEIGDKTWLN